MGIDAIIARIRDEGRSQTQAIATDAAEKAADMVAEAKRSAANLYESLMAKELQRIGEQRQRRLIEVRLENRRALLSAKQELIDRLFAEIKANLKKGRFKKQQVLQSRIQEAEEDSDFYLGKLRQENETEIAAILFS